MERYMGLGSLAAGLQHEIKNPLSALSLHLQLLDEQLQGESTTADVRELLDVLRCEITRVNEVLDRFRNYASTTEMGRTPVDLPLLIERLVRLLQPQAEQQNVKIRVKLPSELMGLIEGDPIRLQQVLLNLALNALAAMAEGGELTFRVTPANAGVQVQVIDTGKGIPPQIQAKIFDPYFTTRDDGTGMGLALSDKIVRQHGGSMEFRTTPRGTEFTVWLPAPSGTVDLNSSASS
jgi:signal transduction histidine kinase